MREQVLRPGHKAVLASLMSIALGFGFLHLVVEDFRYDFDRLHIFLFNLCAGGFLLLRHTQGGKGVTGNLYAYLLLSLAYAISAFLEIYPLTLLLSAPLVVIVEQVRIKRFSLLPLDFLRAVPRKDKFLQASMLCLSMGIVIASMVIINNEYLHWFVREKLTIDVFFLGYSFPLSLLTMAVMFSFMKPPSSRLISLLEEIGFWSITGGVVIFFVFIIFEVWIAEVAVSCTLLAAVLLVYWLFVRGAEPVQQRVFLVSGMAFLVGTGLTGIYYIFEYMVPSFSAFKEHSLVLHATIALYGWNLSGLLIVARWNDFPIWRRIRYIVGLHWLTVLVLVPAGKFVPFVAALAFPAFACLVWLVFFNQSRERGEGQ